MLLVPKAHELESAEKCHTSLMDCVVYQADEVLRLPVR
jgi:hypothetical protein